MDRCCETEGELNSKVERLSGRKFSCLPLHFTSPSTSVSKERAGEKDYNKTYRSGEGICNDIAEMSLGSLAKTNLHSQFDMHTTHYRF